MVGFLAHEVGEAGPSHGSLVGQTASKDKGGEETCMKWGVEFGAVAGFPDVQLGRGWCS